MSNHKSRQRSVATNPVMTLSETATYLLTHFSHINGVDVILVLFVRSQWTSETRHHNFYSICFTGGGNTKFNAFTKDWTFVLVINCQGRHSRAGPSRLLITLWNSFLIVAFGIHPGNQVWETHSTLLTGALEQPGAELIRTTWSEVKPAWSNRDLGGSSPSTPSPQACSHLGLLLNVYVGRGACL